MQYDEIMQATLLLCSYFNKTEVKIFKPLTGAEYLRFAKWLHENNYTPADLFRKDNVILDKWTDPKRKITTERLLQLLGRGGSMGFAIEKWDQQGIWVISRASEFYPRSIKKQLSDQHPPILYGLGNKQLLNQVGIGFVGSRPISEDDTLFTVKKVQQAVDAGYTLISGGAKGIDQTSMRAALEYGGQSVGILSDGVLVNSNRRELSRYLRDQSLALVSPFYPEAGFSVGNAMARNKYIYTMSQAVVVVKSDKNKGGTWGGAIENLKKAWVPLLVRDCTQEGNQALIQEGGIPLGESKVPYSEFLEKGGQSRENSVSYTTGATNLQPDLFAEGLNQMINDSDYTKEAESIDESLDVATPQYGEIFKLFKDTLKQLSEEQETFFALGSIKYIYPELQETQIKKWLKELEAEGYVRRDGRKLRYAWLSDEKSNNNQEDIESNLL
ncbi:DNA-processing protein DprA [bacterium]|nr:DNA-processing protein DprA [bacterium]